MLPVPSAGKAKGGTANSSEEQHALGCWTCSRASRTALGKGLCSTACTKFRLKPHNHSFVGLTEWLQSLTSRDSFRERLTRPVTASSAATRRNPIAARHRSAIHAIPLSSPSGLTDGNDLYSLGTSRGEYKKVTF